MTHFNIIKELVYPRRCPACDRPVKPGLLICRECEDSFLKIEEGYCMKCGSALDNEDDEYCNSCMKMKHRYTRGRALYQYKSVNRAIYKFKYSGRAEYADYFGLQLARTLKDEINAWNPDVIVPVPLHHSKLRLRGYNQAELLASSLSKHLSIPVHSDLVIRSKKTIPMKELNGFQRQINLRNTFIVRDYDVKLNRVLLVDDIYTTGSTIDAISYELHRAGVSQVYFVSLSIGSGI